MRAKELPTQAELQKLFDYDADTGLLLNRFNRSSNSRAGQPTGAVKRYKLTSYRKTRVDGNAFYDHRLIWKLVYGRDPKGDIDHVNGNGLDNRLENLRDVDRSANGFNQHTPSRGKSGIRGIHWRERNQYWECYIAKKHIGVFANLLDAVAARYRAERAA